MMIEYRWSVSIDDNTMILITITDGHDGSWYFYDLVDFDDLGITIACGDRASN